MDNCNFIFGVGKMLKKVECFISWNDITALVDNDCSKQGKYYQGLQIIHPNELRNYNVNYIFISTKRDLDSLCNQIISMGIDPNKIICLGTYLLQYRKIDNPVIERFYYSDLKYAYDCAAEIGAENLLHVGDTLTEYGVSIRCDDRMARWYKHIRQEQGLLNFNKLVYTNGLYDAVFYRTQDIPLHKYNAAFLGFATSLSQQLFLSLLHALPVRYLIVRLTHKISAISDMIKKAKDEGCFVRRKLSYCATLLIVDKYPERNKDISIYIMKHKEFHMPITGIPEFKEIWAGNSSCVPKDALCDNVGDNISYLNVLLNECTGLYWIWKHSRSVYVGLCHYRRYFLYTDGVSGSVEHMLKPREALLYLVDYDIILLHHSSNYLRDGVLRCIEESVQTEAFTVGMNLVKRFISERQPDYIDSFERVMSGMVMFNCNMFITKKTIFDRYADWLFSFLIDAAKAFDPSGYDDYSKRIIGFIAERMLTVWLMKEDLKIKELPLWQVEG